MYGWQTTFRAMWPVTGAGHAALRVPILILLAGATAVGYPPVTARAAVEVIQPIEFPHARHAGPASKKGNEINCLYCHSYARRSAVAGIPTLAKCMGCHRYIATDKKSIQTLTEYWETGKPVPWKKVHDLPDFVYFSHERHVQRFVFQQGQPVQQVCGYCHGDVKTMKVAERRKPLRMGWCLSCHKQFQTPASDTPAPAADWVIPATDHSLVASRDGKDGEASGTIPRKAPNDCWACHQ